MAIPKIIHQVWEGRTDPEMPIRLKILARTWQKQNPDWEYHLWNGEEMDKLVETHFPKYLEMYKNFPYPVQRWDTIRYMILYIYGGVYTDLDTECFRSINDLVKNKTFAFGEEPSPNKDIPNRIGNAFLVSEKGNKGWLIILKHIQKHIDKKKNYIETVMNSTGPNMITRIFNELEKGYFASIIPYHLVTPLAKWDMYQCIFLNDRKMFDNKINNSYCAHYFFGSWAPEINFYNKN